MTFDAKGAHMNYTVQTKEARMENINSFPKASSDLERLVDILDALHKKNITLDDALGFIQEVTYAKRALLVLLSPVDGDLYIEAASGLSSEQKKQGHYVVGEGVVGKVIQSGEALFIEDAVHNPLFLNRTHARTSMESVSFLCVPIKLQDKVIGALGIDRPSAEVINPEHEERLLRIIANAFIPYIHLHQDAMQRVDVAVENLRLPSRVKAGYRGIIGNSEGIEIIHERIEQVGPSSTTVMIRGESGTGKELVARSIHENSMRQGESFISLNCAALPESLVESELFGHEKGAFTGATQARKGRFELADGGTLFLDEVGELPLPTQAKLLRVLQEKCFDRIGSTESRTVDVRIIAATNRDLELMVEEGTFRKDLYYRLNVFSITLPSLKERKSDIALLADHFLDIFAAVHHKEKPKIALAASDMLERYSWPGNIRELENIIERAMLLLGQGKYILPQHLPLELHSHACSTLQQPRSSLREHVGTLPERIEELERVSIMEALTESKGHMGQAAGTLGITERIMGQRMRKYGISYKSYR